MKPAAKSLVKWLLIIIAGVVLYYLAAGVAFAERGYKAYGGELVFFLFPLWWKFGEVMTADIKQTIKQIKTEVIEMSKTKNEQVTATVGSLPPKSVFNYGGVNWLVLGRSSGNISGVLCLAEKLIFNKSFDDDNYNNWEDSSLREHLNNDFFEELVLNGAAEEAFLPMTTDLTANDGLKDYGSCEDIITLLSCEQYRKYRDVIPNADDWWWTCTPYSTKANGYEHSVCCVKADGAVNCFNSPWYVSSGVGVRLACDISPLTLVSVIKAGDHAEDYNAGAEATAAQNEDEQDTPPEWYTDDIRTQKAIDGFYECIEVAQQRYKDGKEDFTGIISAMSLIKYLKGDLPF